MTRLQLLHAGLLLGLAVVFGCGVIVGFWLRESLPRPVRRPCVERLDPTVLRAVSARHHQHDPRRNTRCR